MLSAGRYTFWYTFILATVHNDLTMRDSNTWGGVRESDHLHEGRDNSKILPRPLSAAFPKRKNCLMTVWNY